MTVTVQDPNVTIAPPPWRLTGRGYIVGLHCSSAFGQSCAADSPGVRGKALGGLGALMLVDYHESDVGPYQELLLCPGRFRIGRDSAASVTHIWVSTQASVVNGRRHWGLPKEQAVFEARDDDDGRQILTVQRGDRSPLRFVFRSSGPALPITTRLLPQRWHTLEQPWQHQVYRTVVQARGRTRLARLEDCHNPPDSGFPDFAGQARSIGTAATDFELMFPNAHIRAAAEQ